MNREKRKKQSEVIREELGKRSRTGLEFAKKAILGEKIEDEKLRDAFGYYTENWEEFTHGGLFSLACDAVGGDPDAVVNVQAAITMMAAAFDLHDDIIDRSDAKHGVPTVLGRFGKDMALLLGNAFLIEGFSLFGESMGKSPPKMINEVFETLKTSLFEVGTAHALELNMRGRMDVRPEECMKVLKFKAAGIEADMRIGATVGRGTSGQVQVLARYGRILGMLATLREEFIDLFEIDELNQRISTGYLPIPALYAMQDGKSRRKIQELLAKGEMTTKDVNEFVDAVFDAGSVRKLKKTMKDLAVEGVQLASKAPNLNLRKLLRDLMSSALEDL